MLEKTLFSVILPSHTRMEVYEREPTTITEAFRSVSVRANGAGMHATSPFMPATPVRTENDLSFQTLPFALCLLNEALRLDENSRSKKFVTFLRTDWDSDPVNFNDKDHPSVDQVEYFEREWVQIYAVKNNLRFRNYPGEDLRVTATRLNHYGRQLLAGFLEYKMSSRISAYDALHHATFKPLGEDVYKLKPELLMAREWHAKCERRTCVRRFSGASASNRPSPGSRKALAIW